MGKENSVKFLHIIMISLLLAGCIPSAEEMTATATTGAPTLTATHTPTPILTPTPVSTTTSISSETPLPDGDPVLVGSGDIAHCSSDGDETTANLLDSIP
jgi:carbohydrate-binding DOMON domain-containing protein